MTASPKLDVVIAGGGPVGSALALQLAQQDISVALLEQEDTVTASPMLDGNESR